MPTRREFLATAAGCSAAALGGWKLLAASPSAAPSSPGDMISLSGNAHDVGKCFGQLNAAQIRRHVDDLLAAWKERGLSDSDRRERTEPFRQFVTKFAPAWEDEIAGCAEGAGVPLDPYVSFLAGKYRDLFFVEDCTSFLAVGAATADGASLFHKNRDNIAREQCAYRKAIQHSSKPAAFHATADTSDLGVMMVVNENGLAGSADVGGLPLKQPRGRGVMNPYILRLIAERAERCEDALEIVQQMIREGWYAGGNRKGTHWFFADRYGKGLRIAQNTTEEQHWFFQDDVAFSVRGDTPGAKIVTGKKGKITLRDMNAAATDPTICFTSSISAMTVRIDPDNPRDLNSVWFALPAWSTYLPLFPLSDGTPKPVLAGDYYCAGEPLLKLMSDKQREYAHRVKLPQAIVRQIANQQQELYSIAENCEKAIRAALAAGDKAKAVQWATRGTADGCTAVMRFLSQITAPGSPKHENANG